MRLLTIKVTDGKHLRVLLSNSDEIKEVLHALLQLITLGKVTTYKTLAECLGLPPRYIGKILKENSMPIVIPCHRVVRSDLSLGGYTINGRSSPDFKRKLLVLEGVCLSKNRVCSGNVIRTIDELLSQNT
ncbi:MAG: MGMT family protein [Desulfurococcales archaeon]|nr:MGMT family protein [Desulfurococcales archaeon]